MTNKKIFFLIWFLSFFIIAPLCILNKEPLIFHPVDYGLGQFIFLFILLGILSFGLLGVLDILKRVQQKMFPELDTQLIYPYYLTASIGSLFIFTLFAGFTESLNPFLYYFCITNSCIYLLGGYAVTIIASYFFSKREIEEHKS